MEVELRDYTVAPGHMDDWLSGWRDGIMPLRSQCGFTLLGAWLDAGQNRFIWVLGYDGAESFDVAEDRYHRLPERIVLNPDPSSFVVGRLTRVTEVQP